MQADEPIILSGLTLSVAMLTAVCEGIEVSTSTGFLWSHGEDVFAVTNWHCITGVNPESGKSLSRTGARPTHIKVALTTTQMGVKKLFEVPLYDGDGNAGWLVHPTAGEQVDVAALYFTDQWNTAKKDPATLMHILNELKSHRLDTFPGDELLIVGFPRNLHIHRLPLFKRATFASEPALFRDNAHFRFESDHRKVLVDCATREGMSGSPVIQVKRSMLLRPRDDNSAENLLDGYSFYGIYSGRVLDPDEDPAINDLFAAQIGIVWPKPLIERIVQEGKRDRFRRDEAFIKTVEGVPLQLG